MRDIPNKTVADNVQKLDPIAPLKGLLDKNSIREKAIHGLIDCLDATYTFEDKRGTIHTCTDFKTILGAVNTALAYTDGKPIERREVITRHSTSLEELKSQAKTSPELRKALQELLGDDMKQAKKPKSE